MKRICNALLPTKPQEAIPQKYFELTGDVVFILNNTESTGKQVRIALEEFAAGASGGEIKIVTALKEHGGMSSSTVKSPQDVVDLFERPPVPGIWKAWPTITNPLMEGLTELAARSDPHPVIYVVITFEIGPDHVTETDARTTKEVADHVIVLPGNPADQIRIHFLNLGDHSRTRKIANESPLTLAVNALKNELGQHDEWLRDLVSVSTVGKKDKLDFIELLAGKWLKMVEPSLEGVVGFGSRRQRL